MVSLSETLLSLLLISASACTLRATETGGNDAGDTNPSGCTTVTASCDQPTAGPGGVRLCVEYGSSTSTQALTDAESVCRQSSGATWDTKPCTTTGQVAACRLSNGLSCANAWAYEPSTKEIVTQECTPKGGTVVSR